MDTLEVRPNSQASTAKLSTDRSSIASAKSAEEKEQEPTIQPETDVGTEAIPVERQETPQRDEEDDKKEEKKEDGEKSPLTVELPEEAKEETSPESVHHTPTPMPTEEDLRALSGARDVEPPIEAKVSTPLENEGNDGGENDKNDSAISSTSSVTPEKEPGLEERQGTPAIEVA